MKFIRQILKHNLYSLCFSDIRFYSTCNVSFHCLSERENTCENPLNNEHKSIYYFQDGLRKVYPYYYQYSTFCKGPWIHKKVIDLCCNNYYLYPREEIIERISNGQIKVNDNVVSSDYVLKNGDLILSTIHRHERAVLACPIEILFENDDLLVVSKPPSIPVHPCGLYNNNTVLSILAHEYNKHDLHVIYRLDRLASGVLLFAKSSEKCRQIRREMDMYKIKKEYICRVEGNFPDGNVVCNKPIKISRTIGASIIDPKGKVAMTGFKKLSYNGKSSVVLCKPFTGRTHQIRVHLQYLGHPIINDPIYNSFAFGLFKDKNGGIEKAVSQLKSDLYKENSSEWYIEKVSAAEKILNGSKSNFLKFTLFKEYYHMNEELPVYKKDCSKILKDEKCYYCKTSYEDPEQLSLGMFLHAYSYESDKWKFESDMPFWASEDWNIA